MKHASLLLMLALTALAGCGKDEDAKELPKTNYGTTAGSAIHSMLDEAKQSADQVNQHQEAIERRSRPSE